MRADFLGVREGNHAALSSGCCIRTAPTTEPRPFGPYCRLPHGTATVPVAGKLGLCDGEKVHLRRWLRYDGRVGSWLALFALTIQLTVSFGHVHLEGVARTDPALLTLAEAMQASQSLFAHPPGTAGGDDERHRRGFRYDMRLGSWLALFALAVQFTVSFGHVHLEGIARTDPALLALAAAGYSSQTVLAQDPGTGDDDDIIARSAPVFT